MQLQNKNVQVKYNLIIDEDEMNLLIKALKNVSAPDEDGKADGRYRDILNSLKSYCWENKTPLIDGQVDVMPGQYR